MAKKTPIELYQKKKEQIEKLFSEAIPFVQNPKKIASLKEESPLRKICTGILDYLYHGNRLEGCIKIYNVFKIHPNRIKDRPLTDRVKEKLKVLSRTISQPSTSTPCTKLQLNLF